LSQPFGALKTVPERTSLSNVVQSGQALQERGECLGPYMEGPDGYREKLHKPECLSPLKRGLRKHRIQGWETSVN